MSRPEITIGLSVSLSGKFYLQGQQTLQGARLWQSYINAQGGIVVQNGEKRSVRLIWYDDRSQTSCVRKNVFRLLKDDRIDVLLGPYSSSLTMAVVEIAEEYKKVLWNHGGSSDEIFRHGRRHLVGIASPASDYLRALPQWLAEKFPALGRICVLYSCGGRPGTAARKAAVAAATPMNPPQTHGTPRESRIPNFAVLYSRATVILREMTNYWNAVPRSWLARLRVTGSAAVGNLRGCWKSVQKDHRLATFRARILGRLTIAAQRTEFIRQRTALLIGRWSRWTAATAQFLAERISAKLRILTHSQPLRRLRHACRNNFRVLMARATAVYAVMEKKFVAHRGSRPVVPKRRATGRSHLDQE